MQGATVRSQHFDLVKVVAIFLVCYYHSEPLILQKPPPAGGDTATFSIYFFHALPVIAVPLFFMVSGALMLNRSFEAPRHFKRILKLFFLAAFWSLLSNLAVMALRGDPITLPEILSGAQKLKVGYNNHLWFLRALIMVYLLHPLIKLAFDRSGDPGPLYLLLGTVLVFAFGQTSFQNLVDALRFLSGRNLFDGKDVLLFGDINPFGVSGYALAYYVLGGALARGDWGRVLRWPSAVWGALVLAAWSVLFAYGLSKSLGRPAYFDTVFPCYSTAMALIMTLGVFVLLGRMRMPGRVSSVVIQRLGGSTLGIYLIHYLLNALASACMPAWLAAFSPYSIVGLAVYALLLLGASYLVLESIGKIPGVRATLTL